MKKSEQINFIKSTLLEDAFKYLNNTNTQIFKSDKWKSVVCEKINDNSFSLAYADMEQNEWYNDRKYFFYRIGKNKFLIFKLTSDCVGGAQVDINEDNEEQIKFAVKSWKNFEKNLKKMDHNISISSVTHFIVELPE